MKQNLDLSEVQALIQQGLNRYDISQKLGVSEYNVRQFCELHNLVCITGRKPKAYNESKKCNCCNVILPLSNFGLRKNRNNKPRSNCKKCDAQIKREYNAKKPKANLRIKFDYTNSFLNEVLRLFDEGYGQVRIARELGCKQSIINTAYKKLGLTNSSKTRGKTNIRKTHLCTEYYCRKCDKILPIKNFRQYTDKRGCVKIRSLCWEHDREQHLIYSKLYKENNPSKYRESKNKYVSKRMKKDPVFRLRLAISHSIIKALKSQSSSKNGVSCLQFLPFTIQELKNHLENLFEYWMNWDNWGIYKLTWDDNDSSTWTWNIDHIVPHSTFGYASMNSEEFRNCWALSNLRPLAAKKNVFEGARRSRH